MADAYQMFIDGEWVNSSDGQTRDVINPATGEVVASVQEGTKEDANRAVAAAKKAFEGDWYDSTPKGSISPSSTRRATSPCAAPRPMCCSC